jgi:serine/threonine protein phosphatase PrpC
VLNSDHFNITMITEQVASTVQRHVVAGGTAAVYSSRCPETQSSNEDAATLITCGPDRGVLGVADGAGGHPAGQDAARLALSELATAVEEAVSTGDMLRVGIMNGLERANQAVANLGVGAAATVAVAEIDQRSVRPYHVGDCLILVVGQRGKLKLQTIAHSPVGYAVESGLLDDTAAMHHEDRHVVSNAVGLDNMRIEVGPVLRLRPYDTVLLASDGLSDNLHVDEIVELVPKSPLERALQVLTAMAAERMRLPREGVPSKPDDLTCVAFRLGRSPRRRAAANPG